MFGFLPAPITATELSADTITVNLERYGFLHVRGLFEISAVTKTKEALFDVVQEVKNRSQMAELSDEDFLSQFGSDADAVTIRNNIQIGQVDAKISRDNFGFDPFDILQSNSSSQHLREKLLTDFDESIYAHSRIVSQNKRLHGHGIQRPISLHCDAYHHNPHKFGVNVWVPLTPANLDGYPGLTLISLSPQEVIRQTEYNSRVSRKKSINREASNTLFSRRFLFRRTHPRCVPGDALIFTNWTLHGTNVDRQLAGTRASLELRFESETNWHQLGGTVPPPMQTR